MNPTSILPSPSSAEFILRNEGHSCTRKALFSFFWSVLLVTSSFAQQDTLAVTSDPYLVKGLSQQQIKKRIKIVAVTNVVAYSAAMVGLYATWYKDYPQSKFHFFNDIKEWQQIDKVGHAYSAYAESKASMEVWRWTGIDRKKRILLGGFSGAAYQTVIEVLDGFSSEWGFSWGDFGANIVGSGLLTAQEFAWDEQRIQFKWSFHRKHYSDPSLNKRSDDIFGKSDPERFLKDYNGQTYWLSTTLKSFFPRSKIPAWLQVSVGMGGEGMFGARENVGKDKSGNIIFNRPDIKPYRQWYLAPDIDLTKIKTKKKGVRFALNVLNILKFPTPSLEYSKGSMKINWFHF
ncbi:MAG: DUF2279 domain-containing protein [Ferruginibacter sp.]